MEKSLTLHFVLHSDKSHLTSPQPHACFARHLLPNGWHCTKQALPVLDKLLAGYQLALYRFAPCFKIYSMVPVLIHLSEQCHPGLWVDVSECMNTYCNNTSEVQSKMIFMGHQISSCHVPVVRSFSSCERCCYHLKIFHMITFLKLLISHFSIPKSDCFLSHNSSHDVTI